MMGNDKLNQAALKQKWNLVKVICSQPFNKHTKYGISFIAISGVEETLVKKEKEEEKTVKLGAFKLKSEEEDNLSIGSYFQHRKDSTGSAGAELRADRTLASLALQTSAKEEQRFLQMKAAIKKEDKMREESDKRREKKKEDDRPDQDLPRRDVLPGESSYVPQHKHDNHKHKKEKHDDKHKQERHKHDKH